MTGLTRSEWAASPGDGQLRQVTVGDVLREAAEDVPDVVALIAGVPDPADRRTWTYAELYADARRVASWLHGQMEPGERLGIWAPNEPEWVIAQYGAALAGVVVVPVNPAYRVQEAGQVLGSSAVTMVLHADEHRGNDIAAHLDVLAPDLPSLRACVPILEILDRAAEAPLGADLPDVRPGDLAQIQYTSGTTGFPKGACLHHLGIANNARLMLERLGMRAGDVYVNPNPMFHLGGCGLGTVGPPQHRATHVLVHHFEPGLFLDLLESTAATVTGAVPTMLIALMEHPDFASRDLSSLRAVSSGGAVVPADLVRRIEGGLGVTYSTMFGQTEASPGITQTHPEDSPEDKGLTVGRPLPLTDVRIVDPASGEVLPVGEQGELLARSPMTMRGYWELPEATAATLDAEGWLHTGDLCTMDERGFCRVVGRLKDMITRGGENIYPREIEDVLFAHPSVAEVAVVGVPDDRLGEQVAAFIRPVAGAVVVVDELRAHVGAVLARHKVPGCWSVVDQLPTTASGKVQKHLLRDRWIREASSRREPT